MTEREQVIAELLYLKHDCLEGSATDHTLDKAIALLKAQDPVVMAGTELTDAELIEKIRKAPIFLKPNVDAVPVVRCRDCKYFVEHNDGQGGNCNHLDYDGEYEFSVAGDWFCADGERRDEDAADRRGRAEKSD